MKKSFNAALVLLLILMVSIISISGCTPDGASAITDDLILDAVMAVAPSFEVAASRATWSLGSAIYELYGILKEDGEPVGYFNLYDLIGSADDYFAALSTGSSAITLQEVTPPPEVELGFTASDSQYNLYRADSGGTSSSKTYGYVDGANYYMLVAMNGPTDQQVIQGVYDSTTGDIDIRLFYANDTAGGWEKGYAFVSGNTLTHQFTLRIIRDGFAYDHNMVGYGISQGTGYFLMKLDNANVDLTSASYYEFNAANLTVTALQAMDDAGSAAVPANTAGYETSINAVTPISSGSLPTDAELDLLNVVTGISHS